MASYANETKRYDDLYKDYVNKQNADVAQQKKRTTDDYNAQLKQAYISRMQEQKNLNDNLTQSGIRGGATESSNLKLATNYQNTRGDINKEKSRALEDIDIQANDNKFNYKQATDQAKISYIEQREAEDRQIAANQAAENAAREAEKAAKAEAAKVDFWQAKYGGYYSTKSLNNAYKKAKTTQEKAIIKARINYLKSHKKGY